MAEPIPPGRAGRLWLRARLAAARRSLELLDRKQQLLQRELFELNRRHAGARRGWEDACGDAERWGLRATVLGGAADVALAAGAAAGGAEVQVAWGNTMGVRHPVEAALTPAGPAPVELAASNGAVAPAAAAHRRALEAAVAFAVLDRSRRVLRAELEATQRRRRAVERRRLPSLETALELLEERLDELERQERVIAHWARQGQRSDH